MQLNESKHTLQAEIDNIFHIKNDFYETFKQGIYPIIKAFETALNRDLLLEKEKKNYFFEFDIKELIKANVRERYEAYRIAKDTGFLTINEIREAENLETIEGMNVINVGLSSVLYDEDKNELITRAESILKNAKEAEKELTEEEIKEVKELHERAQKIKEEINLREENEKMLNELKEDKETNIETRAEEKSKETLEREEFSDFIRGKVGLNKRATLTNMTFTDNSAVVPKTIVNEIIRKVYDISPILERSTRYNVSGTLELPYYPALNDGNYDNITVGYQSEFSEITSTSGKFSTIELKGYLAGALTKISLSLINNAQFDIVNFVVNEMAYQISRFIEKELIHGTENKVAGLSTLSNTLTAASASAITADEVIKLKDMVKDEYQNAGIFIMSPATRTALRLLKDQRGMYLLNDDISTPFGTNLLGKPVFVSDNMDDMAASKTTIFYGDMTGLATNFSEQINIQVLREHYAPMHAVGVVGFFEFDSKVANEQKIAKLVMAAS